jgi:hypothetical protein
VALLIKKDSPAAPGFNRAAGGFKPSKQTLRSFDEFFKENKWTPCWKLREFANITGQ